MLEADFVIVGSGSAGAAMAYRLSEDGRNSVIVIEYGGTDIGPFIQMPAALSFPMNMSRYDWGFQSEPEPHLGGRVLATPRGKVIGGSSSINGMVYVRGHAHDFDHWAESGAAGWAYADVLPYFKRMEHSHGGEDGWRGTDGPMHVQRGPHANPLYAAFREAGRQAGFETTDDYNGSKQEGFGAMEQTIHGGRRWSTANAYMRPALRRQNVSLVKGLARRVVIENQRATGVEIEARNQVQVVKARREVIIAASSINSPKLLMLSGIGAAAGLREQGIGVVADRPGVGANLQDHLQIRTVFRVTGARTLNQLANSTFGKMSMAVEYGLFRNGPLSMAPSQLGLFSRSDETVETPDLEYHIQPLSTDKLGDPLHRFPAVTVSVCNLRPQSRGTCHVRSRDVAEQPAIRPLYLSADRDRDVALKAIRQVRRLTAAKALTRYAPSEMLPGPSVVEEAELLSTIGSIGTTIFHPVGTCRMGTDEGAVVDPQLRVRGLRGLRVIDASVMPTITSGNTASPVIMIAEKAADEMLRTTAA